MAKRTRKILNEKVCARCKKEKRKEVYRRVRYTNSGRSSVCDTCFTKWRKQITK